MSTIANTLKTATLRMSSLSSINCGTGRNFVAPAFNMMMNIENSNSSSNNENTQFNNNNNNNNFSAPFKFNTYTQPFERTPFVIKNSNHF